MIACGGDNDTGAAPGGGGAGVAWSGGVGRGSLIPGDDSQRAETSYGETVQSTTTPETDAYPRRIGPVGRPIPLWLFALLVCGAVAFGMVIDLAIRLDPAFGWHTWVGYAATAVVVVAIIVQRTYPEPGVVLAALGLAVLSINLGGALFVSYGLVMYEAWFISAHLPRRRALWLAVLRLGSVAAIAGLFWSVYVIPTDGLAAFLLLGAGFALLSSVLMAVLGAGTRLRWQKVADLTARAELAALTERTRIAREMHDIIAHSLTAIIVQADGGRYAGRSDPDKALRALETISVTGRQSMAQMRSLLSVLRSDDQRSRDVVPGIDNIADLITTAERDNLTVDVQETGERGTVSEAFGLATFRIVQECLTNVLKHAGPTAVTVRLAWQPRQLDIRVDNAPGQGLLEPVNEPGRGLRGIAERAVVHGGYARWGPSTVYEKGFAVHAVLRR